MTRGRLIVDAANVVGSRPDGWWRDRPGAARRLLEALARGPVGEYEVVLVLEGGARPAAPEGVVGGVRVVHAAGSGDDAITELAAHPAPDASSPVTVVTADRELRERVSALGAATMGPGALWELLERGD